MEIKYLQVGPIGTNCYLLCDEKARVCAVIDPGGEARRIASAIRSTGCTPAVILLTHGHYDDTGAVDELRAMWPDVPAYLNRKDTALWGAPASIFPPLRNTTHYGEGDTVAVGGLTVSVMETPGHSAGSVTLRCNDALFCGDTLFAGDCGRTDLYGGSMEAMLDSLRRLGELEGNLLVLPGHEETSTLDREREQNAWLRRAMMNIAGSGRETQSSPMYHENQIL